MNENRLELVVNNDEEIPLTKPGRKEPPIGDWLSGMKMETEFKVRDKTGRYLPDWIRADYMHGGLKDGLVLLIPVRTVNDIKTWNWVEPVSFCRTFELASIDEEPEEE